MYMLVFNMVKLLHSVHVSEPVIEQSDLVRNTRVKSKYLIGRVASMSGMILLLLALHRFQPSLNCLQPYYNLQPGHRVHTEACDTVRRTADTM